MLAVTWRNTFEHDLLVLKPNKKICAFRITGLKILDRVGTHIFLIIVFSGKKYNFMHFERRNAFQNV